MHKYLLALTISIKVTNFKLTKNKIKIIILRSIHKTRYNFNLHIKLVDLLASSKIVNRTRRYAYSYSIGVKRA